MRPEQLKCFCQSDKANSSRKTTTVPHHACKLQLSQCVLQLSIQERAIHLAQGLPYVAQKATDCNNASELYTADAMASWSSFDHADIFVLHHAYLLWQVVELYS